MLGVDLAMAVLLPARMHGSGREGQGMTTTMDVALEMAGRHGLAVVLSPDVRPGIVEFWSNVPGQADEVRVHVDAADYDLARNAGGVFPVYPLWRRA